MSPGGNHFLGADDMSRAEKDCASMAKYLHEKCVGTGHERSFYLCVLDLISRILCKFRRTSRNRRYAPAGHLLRGVWPSIMYNDHAL